MRGWTGTEMNRRGVGSRGAVARVVASGLVVLVGLLAQGPAGLAAQQASVRVDARDGERGWLGLSLREFPAPPGAAGSVDGVRLVVTDLFRGGPAERSGLRPGDVLMRLNGAPADILRFRSLAGRLLPGDPMALTVLREGRTVELSLEAGAAPDRGELVRQVLQVRLDSARIAMTPRLDSLQAELRSMEVQLGLLSAAPRVEVTRIQGDSLRTLVVLTHPDGSTVRIEPNGVFGTLEPVGHPSSAATTAPRGFVFRSDGRDSVVATARVTPAPEPEPRSLALHVTGANRVAGAQLQAVDAALGAYFGVSRGLLVLDLADGTPAQRAGLESGDVIVRAAGREVHDIATFRAILARSAGPVALEITRRGRTASLVLPR